MKKLFKKLTLKLSLFILKSKIGVKLTQKLDLEVAIFSSKKEIFRKKLERDELVKIFDEELNNIKKE